jgi:aromatic-L-amino-acid/L-tryptophan decarboxylase
MLKPPTMTPDEFRRLGHMLIDWVADYRARVSSFPVMSQVSPGDIRERLPSVPPLQGESLDALPRELEELILPGITHWAHPSFFAYFPSNSSLTSVLADIVSTGIGAQAMSWQTSPAATELEETVVDWLRQMIGLPEPFVGVIQDTASTSTLVALLCARERTTDFGQTRGGLQSEPAPVVVYASEHANSSVSKAALLAGFGRANLRLIEADGDHALSPKALEAKIRTDLAEGRKPCAIVATTGTTATTALDPINAIADIASTYKLWLHVDAALAGSAMILPECRWMWRGVERADSLVVNPHKWLGAAFDCSLYFVRDAQHLIRVMSTNPSYLQTSADGQAKNFRDWGLPLGRRFRALKPWLLIRDAGVAGLQARLRRDLALAQWLKSKVDADPGWERMAPVWLQTVCMRHLLPGVSDERLLAAHNLAIAEAINQSGNAYLTPAILNGKQILRVSIGAELTQGEHVERLWRNLVRWANHPR